MSEKTKPYTLITGASKGIGKSIAYELAKQGYPLLLIARSEEELKALSDDLQTEYAISTAILAIDLSINDASQRVSDWIKVNNYPVGILINNAGYGVWGDFSRSSLTDQLGMMQLNMNVVVELSHLLIPILSQEKQAYILNISSTAAYQAVPTLAVYSAAKAFVLSFTRALRFELSQTSISVTCFSPGPVDTGFAARAGLTALNKMAEKFNMQPNEVAKMAVKAMFSKKSEVIPGLTNIISVYANRILPKAFIEKTAAGIYKI
ncbi:SDR family NAD(P)-dependent oxidoreductase [Flavobacterium fluviale]|uniref:SDR family NAD(P)-dependent oxidoreductase n=1 Tax=Flavobacterium fluviale TaxID=2249356 RepID=A0A344LW17_9FLAO|nr:SDR family oxidoreductase [Flavobacterium fluviale]AXB58109.1 SDR family NAD(P)-dependent oxidoreductase [Flavobacterium fluviale]